MNILWFKRFLGIFFFAMLVFSCDSKSSKKSTEIKLEEGQYISRGCSLCPSAFAKNSHCKEGEDEIVGEIFGCGTLSLGCRAICQEKKD